MGTSSGSAPGHRLWKDDESNVHYAPGDRGIGTNAVFLFGLRISFSCDFRLTSFGGGVNAPLFLMEFLCHEKPKKVPIRDLFTEEFISRHTGFNSLQNMVEASGVGRPDKILTSTFAYFELNMPDFDSGELMRHAARSENLWRRQKYCLVPTKQNRFPCYNLSREIRGQAKMLNKVLGTILIVVALYLVLTQGIVITLTHLQVATVPLIIGVIGVLLVVKK